MHSPRILIALLFLAPTAHADRFWVPDVNLLSWAGGDGLRFGGNGYPIVPLTPGDLTVTGQFDPETLTVDSFSVTGDPHYVWRDSREVTIDATIEATRLVSGGTGPFDPPVYETTETPTSLSLRRDYLLSMDFSFDVPGSLPMEGLEKPYQGVVAETTATLGTVDMLASTSITVTREGVVRIEDSKASTHSRPVKIHYAFGGTAEAPKVRADWSYYYSIRR